MSLNLTPQGVSCSQSRPRLLIDEFCAPQLIREAQSAGGCLALELTAPVQCVNSLSEAFPLCDPFILSLKHWD